MTADVSAATPLEPFHVHATAVEVQGEELAAIIGGPPYAFGQLAALRQDGAVGDTALATQEPSLVGELGEVSDALVAVGGDRAT